MRTWGTPTCSPHIMHTLSVVHPYVEDSSSKTPSFGCSIGLNFKDLDLERFHSTSQCTAGRVLVLPC